METKLSGWTLAEIAEAVGGTVRGTPDVHIKRAVPAGYDDPNAICFAESEQYLGDCLNSAVGAVIVWRDAPEFDKPAILVDSPRAAFGRVLAMTAKPLPISSGVHPMAVVSPDATVDPTASVGAFAVVESGAVVGADCRIYPFAYVGSGCCLGSGCVINPQVVLYYDVVLGDRCIIHAGTVLGADGFGFVWDGTKHQKVPQVGGIRIGNDVEIGANTCIDRATCGETVIGEGTKLDNLIHIAHNVVIGDHTVLAGQVGISGSSRVGNNVMMGGQCAVSDHVSISDGITFGGRSGAFQDVEQPGEYFGLPPMPLPTAMRLMALQQRLPDMFKRIKELEKKVEELSRSEEL